MPARTPVPHPRGGSPGAARGDAPARDAGTAAPGVSLREIATYSSSLFGLLCLIKVYGVARYSTTTTATLVTTAPERVILGTLAIYVYPTMAGLAYGIPWLCVRWRDRVRPGAWPVLVAVVLITALMTPPAYHLAGLALVALSVLLEVLLRRRATVRLAARLRIPQVPAALRGNALAFLGGAALLLGFLDTLESPWMSAELFVLKGSVVTATQQPGGTGTSRRPSVVTSADPVVGYLIDESSADLVILHAGTRYVMHVPKSLVRGRYTCHEADTQLRGQVPLLDTVLGRAYTTPNSDCDQVRDQLRRLPDEASGGLPPGSAAEGVPAPAP
ncbi:MAG TPA: hypothetical protein VFP72_23955 [Kineosporiaceae bacterium]|nr:hypothetical protein [Kineosporiaceae bacterium]